MFRKMRRFKQQLSDEETVQIIQNGEAGILGVNGDDGYPYTVPINYVYADGKIYFHGAKTGHKQDAIRLCDKVSLCVVDKDDIVSEELTTYFKSVILFGRARVLETDKEIKREWSALSCIEITIEHMTGKEAIELTRERNNKSV